ncbi:hypothetical protein BH10BDE1_BH10BDE1_29700 [soil metagenome]
MSIFLALVFQVLFVFFAMVINIGLLVHDKINLQNSVDLGAYYAAQKQAEILNEIAHLNYEIRQDYKLLAWRYWVLGTLGRSGQPTPATAQPQPAAGGIFADAPRRYSPSNPGAGIEEVPVACLANPFWWEFAILSRGAPPNENYCWHPYNWTSPTIPIPTVPSTPATMGVNIFARRLAQQSLQNYTQSCNAASPLSWAFVATILTQYKYSIAYKKKAIRKLRENLVSASPVDRDGRAIRDGVIQTIKKNLTESNQQSFDPTAVQMLNGLSKGGCEAGNSIYPGAMTMPEILTAPGLYFAALTGTGDVCQFDIAFQVEINKIANPPGVGAWDPDGSLRNQVAGEPGDDDEYHSSLGFEKNPWCMAYMGVKAGTSPRKPFAPFGKSVNLFARAFAQPFGGRIGPWYAKKWTRASPTSDSPAPPAAAPAAANAPVMMNPAAGQQDRTDPLTSPRKMPGAGGYVYSSYTIPNYSRYPGDRLGMRSMLAQASARTYLSAGNVRLQQPANGNNPGDFSDGRVRLNWFYGYSMMNTTGDSLAFDDPAATNNGAIPIQVARFRETEITAVAPDLFDITYYSIDPTADLNYVALARSNPARYGINGVPMGDLGSRENIPDMRQRNVSTQVTSATTGGIPNNLLPNIYWVVRDWKHLLTSWAPNRAANFNFPTDRFGKCAGDAIQGVPIPGRCVAGGRVGYSVRLIAREHLNAGSAFDTSGLPGWNIGGDGVAPGPILNPPGLDADF